MLKIECNRLNKFNSIFSPDTLLPHSGFQHGPSRKPPVHEKKINKISMYIESAFILTFEDKMIISFILFDRCLYHRH